MNTRGAQRTPKHWKNKNKKQEKFKKLINTKH